MGKVGLGCSWINQYDNSRYPEGCIQSDCICVEMIMVCLA